MSTKRTDAQPIVTMTAEERARMDKLLAGLERSKALAEGILADEQVLDFILAFEAHREELGLSKTDVARAMGIQLSQLNRWVSAESAMKASTMFLLARMLGYRIRQEWEAVAAGYVIAGSGTAAHLDPSADLMEAA